MLQRVILVALAIGYVNAVLNDCHMYGAVMDLEKGRCKCAPGQLGNPNLCCYFPNNNKGCFVAGDPIVNSFYGKGVPVDFPCGTKLSSSIMGSCCVETYIGSEEMMYGGVFYTSKAVVRFRKNKSNIATTFTFTANENGVPTLAYKNTYGVAVDSSMTDLNYPRILAGLPDKNVMVSWAGASNVITMNACGAKINIRLTKSSEVEQRVPGVCVVTGSSAQINSARSGFVCSLNADPYQGGFRDLIRTVIKPMNAWVSFTPLLSDATAGQYISKCNDFTKILGACRVADRENALKKCAFFIFNPPVKACVTLANGPSDPRFAVFNNFMECVNVYCKGQAAPCISFRRKYDIKNCAPSMNKCLEWLPYRRNNRVVAGEGEQQSLNGQQQLEDGVGGQDGFDVSQLGILGPGQENEQNNDGGGVNPFNFDL